MRTESPLDADLANPVGVNLFGAARFMLDLTLPQRVDLALAAGVQNAELHSFLLFPRPAESLSDVCPDDLAEVQEQVSRLRRLSLHSAFANDLLAARPSRRATLFQAHRFAIDQAAQFGAECVVIHFSPWAATSTEDFERGVAVLRELADHAQSRGVRLGVENGSTCPDAGAFVRLIDFLDHPCLGATLDTGHLTGWVTTATADSASAAYNEVLCALADELLTRGKLFHVHLSDVAPVSFGDHYAPGTGLVDFDRLFERLQRSEYDGLTVAEMHRGAAAATGSLTQSEFRDALRHARQCWARAQAISREAEPT